MIFVTVGTQAPFARLIDAMDDIAAELMEPVVAQTLVQNGRWANLQSVHSLDAERFASRCRQARCIVGHVGIGTYLAARDHAKPFIAMPRRAALGEHRSDHQLDTAAAIGARIGVRIVSDADDLRAALSEVGEPVEATPESSQTLLSELAAIVS